MEINNIRLQKNIYHARHITVLFDSRRCRTSSDRIPLFMLVRCAQEKGRPEQITHKESVHQPFTSHTAQPTVQRPKSACPLRLTDPFAPLNDALRSRGGVRVDASAPRD